MKKCDHRQKYSRNRRKLLLEAIHNCTEPDRVDISNNIAYMEARLSTWKVLTVVVYCRDSFVLSLQQEPNKDFGALLKIVPFGHY